MSELDNVYTSVPEPEYNPESEPEEKENLEITADDIFNEIVSENEDGYCPCTIAAVLEELINVTGDEEIDDLTEDQRHEVESDILEFCKVDVYSLNGDLVNVVLKFDTPQDAYLKDAFNLLNRYRRMVSHYAEAEAGREENEKTIIPMFSLQIVPDKFEGKAAAIYSFPVAFFKTLDEDGKQANLHLIFEAENTIYSQIDISDDELAEITADAMREIENANNVVFH